MNCQEFQNQLFEYVEGSLSANAQTAADNHLAACPHCQQSVRQEQQRARCLFEALHQETKTLSLRPEIRQRVLNATLPDSVVVSFWSRFAWPTAIAASLVLIGVILSMKRVPNGPSPISIQATYRVPIHNFHMQGNLVVDSLTYETISANETFQVKNTP